MTDEAGWMQGSEARGVQQWQLTVNLKVGQQMHWGLASTCASSLRLCSSVHEVAQYRIKGTCSIRTDMSKPCMSKHLLSTASSRRRGSPASSFGFTRAALACTAMPVSCTPSDRCFAEITMREITTVQHAHEKFTWGESSSGELHHGCFLALLGQHR